MHLFFVHKITWLVVKSQCSTLVRNTVVRATFKVNGKPPISGAVAPNPLGIDLKFDMGDYVGEMTPHAENGKNRPRRADAAKGWNVKVKCGLFFFIFFYRISCPPLETSFCIDRHRFCARWRVSVGIDFLGESDFFWVENQLTEFT